MRPHHRFLPTPDAASRPQRRGRLRGRLRLLWACGFSAFLTVSAMAQGAYPSKYVRVIVPFGAGSSPDVIARFWGERFAKAAGQPVIVENRPGASTIIGAQAVAGAAADGYTLLYTVNNTTSINPYVYKTLPYRPDDFAPVIRLLSVPYVLVVSAKSAYKTVPDLLNAARQNPGKLNYASYGIGQGTHVAMAGFLNAAGVSMVHVPYKEGMLTDVIGGSIDAMFDASTTAIPQVKGGKLRALAVTGPGRIDVLPDVPAVKELFPGFVGDSWHGILAPKGTPKAVIARVNAVSQQIVESAEFKAKLHELGLVAAGGSAADFQQFLSDDSKAWAKVVRDNGIKVD